MVLVIPLFVLAAVFVAIGLSASNKAWSDALVGWLGNSWFNFFFEGAVLAKQALALSQWVAHKLGSLADPLVDMAVQWVNSLRIVVLGLWDAALGWPVELFRLASTLVWHTIPNAIKAATASTVRTVSHTVTVVQHLPGVIVRTVAVSQAQIVRALNHAWPALTHGYLDSWNWLRRHQRALEATIAASAGALSIPGIIARDLPIPFGRTVAQIRRRLRALERRSFGALAVGALAATLARMGLSWIRCSNVLKAGRGICRAPVQWLEGLLAGLVVIYGVVNIRTLARELHELTGAGAKEIQRFWGGGVAGIDRNPALGEIGTVHFLNTDASFVAANPHLGDVA